EESALRLSPLSVLVTLTFAPGITAPVLSLTTPEMVAVGICAGAFATWKVSVSSAAIASTVFRRPAGVSMLIVPPRWSAAALTHRAAAGKLSVLVLQCAAILFPRCGGCQQKCEWRMVERWTMMGKAGSRAARAPLALKDVTNTATDQRR